MAENQTKEDIQQPVKRKTSPFKITLIIVGLLFAFFIVKLFLILAGTPTISVNYVAEYNQNTRPANYDPNKDAAPYYEKVFEMLVGISEFLIDLRHIWPADMDDAELGAVESWVASNSQMNTFLEMASQKPYCWIKQKTNWLDVQDIGLSNLGKFREVAYCLGFQAKLNASGGEMELALQSVIDVYKIGTHLCGPKTLPEQLLGMDLRGIAVRNMLTILGRKWIDAKTLEHFQQQFEYEISEGKKELYLQGEKLFIHDIIQRVFTDNGKGNGRLILGQALKLIQPLIVRSGSPEEIEIGGIWMDRARYVRLIWLAFTGADRKQTVEVINKFFAYVDTLKNQTPWQLHSKGIDSDEQICSILKGYLIEEAMPAIYRVIERYHTQRAKGAALITTLALLRYKADNGHFPKNLEQLISTGYLKELPMDPYSDGPLVYRRVDDDFVLYSLGRDFDDDGGVRSKWGEGEQGGDQVFWPVEYPERTEENAKGT